MSRRRDERGAVAVLTAILCLSLFAVAALVIDLGLARDTRRQSQNGSDASALAGANLLYPASGKCVNPSGGSAPCTVDAVTAVKAYALNNFAVPLTAWAGCTDSGRPSGYTVASDTACISFDSSTAPRTVRVRMPTRTVTTSLSRVVGVENVPIGSSAEASLRPSVKCALCFMGPVATNNTDFTVNGGSIAVKSTVDANSNSNWTATGIGIAGAVTGSGKYTPAWTPIQPFADPFAAMVLPVPATAYTNVTKTNPCSQGPGVYGDVDLPKGDCTLTAGIYVIRGAWGMKNNTTLKGTGVTLYLQKPGSVDFKNGDLTLTAPTSGATSGFVLLADRDVTAAINLQGNGNTSMTGKVYTLGAGFTFNGNSCFGFGGGPIVVASSSSVGNKSCMTVNNAIDTAIDTGDIALSK